MKQMAFDHPACPSGHRSYPKLTAEQRRTINEVWDEVCVPALEEVAVMKRQVVDARIEAQDAREALRLVRAEYDRLRWRTRAGA